MSKHKEWDQFREDIINSGEYPEELWLLVENFAENLLIQGRPNFDLPHTHGVVYWAYELSKAFNEQIENGEIDGEEPVDTLVLITAAWLHDIGYFGQFEDTANYMLRFMIKRRCIC